MASYRIQGIASNIPYADLPSMVQTSFALTGQADSYTCLSLAIEFSDYFSTACTIDVDNWSVSGPSADSPQCSFDECVGDCGTLDNGPLSLHLEVSNLRWSQPLGDAINTFPLERFQFTRGTSYGQPWDDDERAYTVNRGANPCDDDCNSVAHDDDAYCGCTTSSNTDCDDDLENSNNACPVICDDDYTTTSCNDGNIFAGCSSDVPFGQYRWSVRYTPDASTDISCGGNRLPNVQNRLDCRAVSTCDHALHPTESLNFRPADVVGLYAGSLASGACPMFGTPCTYSDTDYVQVPAFDNEDDEDDETCNARTDSQTVFSGNGLTCMVPGSSFASSANEPYPLTEGLYRDLAFDGSADAGVFSKTMSASDTFYTVPQCGHCVANSMIGTRFYHYDMSPTCTAYRFASSTSGAPLPGFSVDFDSTNGLGATTSGFTYTAGMAGLSAQGTAVLPEQSATNAAIEIITDPGVLQESLPTSVLDAQNDVLIECSIDAPLLGPSDGTYPYPLDTCSAGGCTPLDQTALSETGDGRRSLWYILPYEDMVSSGMAGACSDFRTADSNVRVFTGFMNPHYNFNEGDQKKIPYTETESQAMYECPYSQAGDTHSDALFCRAANTLVKSGDEGTTGFSSSPAYVAAAFDQWSTEHAQWLLDGGVGSGLAEPLWQNYEAHRFMPDQYEPLPAPNIWLSLEGGAGAVFFVPGSGQDSPFETQVNLYFPSVFTGPLTAVVTVDLTLFASESGFLDPSGSGELLPPQNLCPALAGQCDTANPTFDTCSYTLFSIGISDSGGSSGFVDLELDIGGCVGFTIPPLCNSQDSACSTVTQNTFSVSATQSTPVDGALFFAIDPLAGVPGSPNCYTECTVQVFQRLGSGSTAQRFAVSTIETVPSCSETNTVDATGVYGNEPDPTIAYICSQISRSPSATPNQSASASPTPSLSCGASPSKTASASPTRTRSRSHSRSLTVSHSNSPGIPTSTPSPSFGSGNSTDCGACEFSCFSSPADWILSPCIWAPILVAICIAIGIAIGIGAYVKSRKSKEKKQ